MKVRNIIPFILIALFCFFLISCASLLSTQGNSPSKVNSVKNDSSDTRVANKINSVSNKPLETKVTDKIDSISDESAETEEVNKIDYASFYVDSTKEESIEADQVFVLLTDDKNFKDSSSFVSLGLDITLDDVFIYIRSSALVGDSINVSKMVSYLGYEIDENEFTKAVNYSKAKILIAKKEYVGAIQLLCKDYEYQDSRELANAIIKDRLADFKIGDIGPAGGYIFYDKGSYSDGWRYLEAASEDLGLYGFGGFGENTSGTTMLVGEGKSNTEKIILALGTDYNYAAKACADCTYNEFSDWFLPSKEELDLMKENLYERGLGSFDSYYWSSSECGRWEAYCLGFEYSSNGRMNRYETLLVRPIRAF